MPWALFLSFILIASELVLGGLLILKVKPKLTALLVFLMMIFFTLTTLNDALYSPVPDCGCFGDALVISNWQTFYKNLVLMVFVFVLFLHRNTLKAVYRNSAEWTLAVALIALFIGFTYLNYINLPMLDFRAWKVGNRLYPENPLPANYYLSYKNKNTGEVKEYLSPDYPYNDPEWVENWEFVSQRVDDPNRIPGMDLAIIDFSGQDVTNDFLRNPDYHFIVVAWDLASTDAWSFGEIDDLYRDADENGYSFIVLTSTLPNRIQRFMERENLSFDMPFFNADDIALKTMIRSNPGLILVKDGVVIDKWHFNHFPDWEELEEDYLHKSSE
jgi:energy-coupling factor transporter transmembrane protein EcfT